MKNELKLLSKQLKKIKQTNIVCGAQMGLAIMNLPKFSGDTSKPNIPFVNGTWDKFTITVDTSIGDKGIYDSNDNYISEIDIDFDKIL